MAGQRTGVLEHLQEGRRAVGFRESLHRGTPSATHLMGPGNVGGGQPWPKRGAQAIKRPAGPGWAQETAGAHWDPFSSQADTSRP